MKRDRRPGSSTDAMRSVLRWAFVAVLLVMLVAAAYDYMIENQ